MSTATICRYEMSKSCTTGTIVGPKRNGHERQGVISMTPIGCGEADRIKGSLGVVNSATDHSLKMLLTGRFALNMKL